VTPTIQTFAKSKFQVYCYLYPQPFQAAEDRYAREVLIHAESIKSIETLKEQLAATQATSRENLSEAANAQAKLEASEGSWRQQKEALDKEIADLNAR